MASGKVKWFDNRRGFGFISQEQGLDVFVHHTSILGSGYKTLQEGELVNYELVDSDKGPKAQNVERAQASADRVLQTEGRRARIALPLGAFGVGHQRPRAPTAPRGLGLDVGPGDRHRSAIGVDGLVHDSRRRT